MAVRMQYCEACGVELGPYEYPYEPDSCSNPKCVQEVRDMLRAEREEAQFRAEQDDFERYR